MRHRSIRRLGMDLFMLLFLAIAATLYLILPLIANPEKSNSDSPRTEGALYIEASWKPGNCDVDLWVKDSISDTAVGYSNKTSGVFDLLKDDLGYSSDPLGGQINRENIISRGLYDGEYIINVHLFNKKECELPIPVSVVVTARESDDAPFKTWFTAEGTLERNGQELTLASFTIYDKKLVKGSLNNIQQIIRPYTSKDVP